VDPLANVLMSVYLAGGFEPDVPDHYARIARRARDYIADDTLANCPDMEQDGTACPDCRDYAKFVRGETRGW
jgi:hypothetical protein